MNAARTALVVVALAWWPMVSQAAPPEPAKPPESGRGTGVPGSGTVGKLPASDSDEFLVIGEVLKPEITVVISRENLNKAYELKLDESFLDKIIESVAHPPF